MSSTRFARLFRTQPIQYFLPTMCGLFTILSLLSTTCGGSVVYMHNLGFDSWPFVIGLISCICPGRLFLCPHGPFLLSRSAFTLNYDIPCIPAIEFRYMLFQFCTVYILPSYGNRLLRNLMTVYSFPKCYILPHIGEYFLPVFVFVFHAPTLVCFWSVRRLCLPSALLQQDSFNRIPSCSHGIPTIFTSLSIIHPTR